MSTPQFPRPLSSAILAGSRAKLQRAQDHFNVIQREIAAFIDPNPYRLRVDRVEGEGHIYELRVETAPEVPATQWAVTIGDCVHNLRCALDYIAWELAGARPDDTRTQFPIFETAKAWSARGPKRIERLPPKFRKFIEAIQPYQYQKPRLHPLNIIQKLDDADKHKLLSTTIAVPRDSGFDFTAPEEQSDVEIQMVPHAVLEWGSVLMRIAFEHPDPAMQITPVKFTPVVAFGPNIGLGRRVLVVENLRNAVDAVETVIARIDEALARPA